MGFLCIKTIQNLCIGPVFTGFCRILLSNNLTSTFLINGIFKIFFGRTSHAVNFYILLFFVYLLDNESTHAIIGSIAKFVNSSNV